MVCSIDSKSNGILQIVFVICDVWPCKQFLWYLGHGVQLENWTITTWCVKVHPCFFNFWSRSEHCWEESTGEWEISKVANYWCEYISASLFSNYVGMKSIGDDLRCYGVQDSLNLVRSRHGKFIRARLDKNGLFVNPANLFAMDVVIFVILSRKIHAMILQKLMLFYIYSFYWTPPDILLGLTHTKIIIRRTIRK